MRPWWNVSAQNEHCLLYTSSVLLRDYETVENYGAEVLSQAGMIAAKTTLSAVVLAFFDWRLALATFAVVPCALPFLWKGFNAMAQSSGRLTKASQAVSYTHLDLANPRTNASRLSSTKSSRSCIMRPS